MREWRKLHSSILTSERIARVSDSAKWLFTLLVVVQDDEGKFPWTDTRIRALTVGTNWTRERTNRLLSELSQSGLIVLEDGWAKVLQGTEKNGVPSNSQKWPMVYSPLSELDRLSEDSQSSQTAPTRKRRVEKRRVERVRLTKVRRRLHQRLGHFIILNGLSL